MNDEPIDAMTVEWSVARPGGRFEAVSEQTAEVYRAAGEVVKCRVVGPWFDPDDLIGW